MFFIIYKIILYKLKYKLGELLIHNLHKVLNMKTFYLLILGSILFFTHGYPLTSNQLLNLLDSSKEMDYIGEPVPQLEHALQAAYLAGESGADNETVVAALFHNIGHICKDIDNIAIRNEFGVINHDIVGANFLRSWGFPEKICQLVLGHAES